MTDVYVFAGIFLVLLSYALVGIWLAGSLREETDRALLDNGVGGPLWGLWVSTGVAILWPVLVFLIALTSGYAALSGVSE